jgi:histidine decarboxylase
MKSLFPNRPHITDLDELYVLFKEARKKAIGYPLNAYFDNEPIKKFMDFHINNCGDPFEDSSFYRLNTHRFEKELITYYADRFNIQQGYWGYVTNGGSEGNLYGMYLGREKCPGAICYFSDQCHYSVEKNARLLGLPYKVIPSLENGEIDYSALNQALSEDQQFSAIVVATIGTTMLGAIDSVPKIEQALTENQKKLSYIHCDAAFFGILLNTIEAPICKEFDFRQGIDSISCSGHKTIGTPIPCGIVIVKKENADRITYKVEYTNSQDNTISGSRNGITPLLMWYEMQQDKKNPGALKQALKDCYKLADYAVDTLNNNGCKAWRNPYSNIVVFDKGKMEVIKKWQLATEGKYSHLIIMPQVKKDIIDQFVEELCQ